jgi:hypothetical protein
MFQSHQIGTLMPNLKCISFDLGTFNSFDLRAHIPTSLEELHLRHQGSDSNHFSLSGDVHLANLATLGVTPYELELFNDGILPALIKLIIYSPLPDTTISLNDALVHAASYCKKLQSLELHDWTKREPVTESTKEWSANSILSGILQHTPKLKEVRFVKCFVDGAPFVQTLINQVERTKDLAITLDLCSGITRQECEEIIQGKTVSVQKFSVIT